MLNIYFGDMPSAIYNTEIYFKNTYEDSWILDDFAKKVIKKVDGSDVIDAQAIKSPVLGVIPPTELSGGVKTLLLIKNCPDEVFNASTCGDNCVRFILELAKAKDVRTIIIEILRWAVMGDKRIYIVAKVFDLQGCIAYRCKTLNEARCVPGTLEAIRADGVQIVILDSPEIYSEYAPYTYVDDLKGFIDRVAQLNRAA